MHKTLSLIAALLVAVASLSAQTTTWPYLYPSFVGAQIELRSGQISNRDVNIHIVRSELHYIENGYVKRLILNNDVLGVRIGSEEYLNAGAKMMRVAARSADGYVLEEVLGDMAALNETGGAYGSSSSSAATRKLSSIDTDSQINQPYMLLQQSKEDGQSVPLLKNYYIRTPQRLVLATKKGISDAIAPERAQEWKAWQKANKIKWKDPNSLLTIIDFLKKIDNE